MLGVAWVVAGKAAGVLTREATEAVARAVARAEARVAVAAAARAGPLSPLALHAARPWAPLLLSLRLERAAAMSHRRALSS